MEETPSKKKVFIPIAIILIIVVGALMLIKASVHKEARLSSQPVELSEGAEVPDLELTKLSGEKTTLAQSTQKVVMINFWATWCEACMEEMPSIVALRNQYASKGFEVLAVNVDENPKKAVPPTAEKFKMNFPIFTDPTNTLTEMFDVHAIPLTVVVNKARKILMVEPGGREWNDEDVHQLLDKWLAE